MTDPAPRYRFRGNVPPSASVKRPVAVTRSPLAAGSAKPADGATPAKGSAATIDIFDVIDSFGGWWGISAGEVDAALKAAGPVETLYVRLNSPGGEATEGVAIANLFRASKANVRVTVYGLAASAASLIAVMGDVVNMAPGSMLMIHDAWAFAVGPAEDMRSAADMLDATSDSYAGVYASKAGGTTEEWRAVMRNDKWYAADAAVAAKLADAVGIDPAMPDNLPPVEDDEDEPDAIVIELDVNVNQAALSAARRFDLSMLPNAPAALAHPDEAPPKTPAEPPETPPTENKEADTMSDTLSKGLRERLGVADDADEATVLAALDEALAEQADDKPKNSTEGGKVDLDTITATLAADGKVVVSQAFLDTLKEGSEAGRAALARQSREDRDKAIAKAQDDGKIGRSEDAVKAWQQAWDRDPATTAKELAELSARFPVGDPKGHQDDGSTAKASVMNDDEAEALAALSGTTKEALING